MTTTTHNQFTAGSGTLYCALELGEATWRLALTVGPGQRPRRRRIPARDLEQLLAELAAAKARFGLAAGAPVVSCYEAGREGFWLHRALTARGVANRVVDSSSIEVPRRMRRAKTDRIDADKLLELLLRAAGGARGVWREVRVPTVAQEDDRQLHRELESLRGDRTRLWNRINGLLATQGLTWDRAVPLPTWVSGARGADGAPVRPWLRRRLEREWAQLEAVEARRLAVEADRRAVLATRDDAAMAQVRQLLGLRGIGINGAWLLVMEIFGWREIRNRRQLTGLVGLGGTPHESGRLAHEQGISKAGNRHVRWMMGQLAWSWLRYQRGSALAQWYDRRFAHGGKRLRKIGIVALARRLLIELWRYLRTGALPAGAELKPV